MVIASTVCGALVPSYAEMSTMSSSLRDESLKYRRAARKINVDAMIRKYAPYVLHASL